MMLYLIPRGCHLYEVVSLSRVEGIRSYPHGRLRWEGGDADELTQQLIDVARPTMHHVVITMRYVGASRAGKIVAARLTEDVTVVVVLHAGQCAGQGVLALALAERAALPLHRRILAAVLLVCRCR